MEAKKKILVFIPEFPVLTETFIERELAKLVERNNVDLVIFSLKKGEGKISDILKPRVFYKRLTVFDIFGIVFYTVFNFSLVSKFLREMKNNAIDKPSVYMLVKCIGYAAKISRFKPDLILAHFLSEPSTLAMYISKILNIPYAISAHARDVTVTSENIKQKVSTAKFINICNKNAYEHVLDQVGSLDHSNVYLMYHGIDVNKVYEGVSGMHHRPGKPLILAVGRFTEKKGFRYLVEASKTLKDRGLNFLVYIVGSGPLYKDLERRINNLGLAETVKILGGNKGISNEETLTYFKSADIFVFPSIQTEEGDVDGVANVLLEAGVFKLPVVATDSGSTGEVIIDEQTGLVVPQKNCDLLAKSIERLLKDKGLAQDIGNRLYNKVKDSFDLDKSILGLEDLLTRNY